MTPSALHLSRFEPVGMVVVHDQILSADAASFDVPNIPQGYKHLLVLVNGRSTKAASTNDLLTMRFNNDSGSNYDTEYFQVGSTSMIANQSLAQTSFFQTGTASVGALPGASSPAGAHGAASILIHDYASTVFRKGFTCEGMAKFADSSGELKVWKSIGEWRSTAALNRITIFLESGNWLTGSRITIYGLGGTSVAEVAGIDGWTTDPAAWTYASATTFTVAGDQTAKFAKGTRIKLTQTTVKYLVVAASSHSAGVTTVTVTGGSDYSLANAAITDRFYSYQASPQGYPSYFNYVPAWTGFSADPTSVIAHFSVVGNLCTVSVRPGTAGTSNATTLTVSLPIASVSLNYQLSARHRNNGADSATPGLLEFTAASTVSVYRDGTGLAWTNTGGKNVQFLASYHI